MTPDQYRERLVELGRLASRLDGDPNHPLEVIFDFYGLDAHDRQIVSDAYQAAPVLVRQPIEPTTVAMPGIDWSKVKPGDPIVLETPRELIDGIKIIDE